MSVNKFTQAFHEKKTKDEIVLDNYIYLYKNEIRYINTFRYIFTLLTISKH